MKIIISILFPDFLTNAGKSSLILFFCNLAFCPLNLRQIFCFYKEQFQHNSLPNAPSK